MDNSGSNYGQSSVRLTNCLFQGNSADVAGGAISNTATRGASVPELTNCSFQGNSINKGTPNSGISRLGGAIYFSTTGASIRATFTNCSFQGNSADSGGAIFAYSRADQDFSRSSCNVYLISCVVFGNGGNKTFDAGNITENVYDLIYAGNSLLESSATNYYVYSGLDNITTSTSPFASPDSPALAANSPAVNAGNSNVQGTDVAGNPRIVGCRIDMGAYEFQYDPAVAITAQPAASSVVCAGRPVSVPVVVSGQYLTYQWYKDSFANPVTGQTSATLTLTNIQPANAGSYSLVVTGGCNSLTSTAFNLTVNQPTVSISPGSATICQGKSVLLTASGANTYTWSNNTTGNTLTATTAGTYSVTGVDGNGCFNSTTAIVTDNQPTVSVSPGSATICQGKSVLLTASGANTYTWSNNTTGNTLTATTAGTYSVTGVAANGCFNSATATITENKPAVSISPNPASICQASSVLLTASGANTYTWNDNTSGNTLRTSVPGTYSVTGVAANGCANSATAIVTDTRPSVSITASPSATVTQGASITLTASGTGLTSFTWVTGSNGNSTVIYPTTSAPYSVTVRNAAGCVTVASLDVTVTPVVCSPVIYVTQTGSGQRDGSSWSNALGSSQLQFGINAAAGCGNNGQVWVAVGTYKPTTGNDRNASFSMRNGVSIYGGFAGTETALTDRPTSNPVTGQPASTTLSGDIGTVGNPSDNSLRVINNPSGLTNSAVLDGFVITGGAGGTLGGGMFNDGSSPALRNCSFVSNSVLVTIGSTSRGGAVYNGNGSSPQLINCRFEGNSILGSGGNVGFGGAISNLTNSSPLLVNCSFLGNSVSGSSNNFGGAMANNVNSNPQLINCSFITNSAVGGFNTRGGAINNGANCIPQLINCSFLGNSVSGSTTNQGGAIANNTSSAQLTNCVLFGNGGSNTFYNVSSPTVASVTATYSLFDNAVAGYTDGPTNLTTTVSPFVSATDTRLNGCSPAINAGDNGANTSTTDLDGNPRVYQNGRIDMGAYEYQGNSAVVTTAPDVSTATVGVAFSQSFIASGGTSPYSYTLDSGSLPTGLSLSNAGVLSGTPTQSGSFTLTVLGRDVTGCLGVSAPYVLTVSDPANPNLTLTGLTANPGVVCVGTVATFTATVGNVTGSYAYTLTNGSNRLTGTAAFSTFSQSVTATGTGSQNFTLTISANGQSASSATALTVNPLPVAGLTNDGPLSCNKTSVTLTASGVGTYQFSAGATPVNGGPTASVTTAGVYSVTVVGPNGCTSVASTTVMGDPSVPLAGLTNDGPLSCTKTSVTLTASGGGTYQFSAGATPITGGPTASVTTAGVYSVTVVGPNGCTSVASTTVVGDPGGLTASLIAPDSFCSGKVLELGVSVTGTGPFSYAWTSANGSSDLFFCADSPSYPGRCANPNVNFSTTTRYSVVVTDVNGCTATAAKTVNMVTTPTTPDLRGTPALTSLQGGYTLSIASGNPVSLSALVEGNTSGTYAWSLNGTQLPVTTFAYTVPGTSLAAPGRYVVAVRKVSDQPNAGCDSAPASLTIIVAPAPLISATPTALTFVNSTQLPGSNPQTYTVSASNLTGAQLLITAPAPYLISVRPGSFGRSQTLPVTDGVVAPTSVTVALVSSQSGTFDGAITHVAGSASATVALSGTTLSPSLSVLPTSLSSFSTTAGTPSAVQTYTMTVLSQTGGLATAPAGVEIRTGTDAFSSSVTIPASLSTLSVPVDVRLSGAGAGSVTGSITHQLNNSSNQSVANVAISGTVSATAPAAVLRVLHRDVDNYADNNAVQPMLQLVNDGAGALPLSALTLRYYLTLEGTAPLSVLSINYAQVGDRNVTLRYVPLNPARQGASGYVEYRFSPDAGSLAPGASSGNIQSYFAKADYSPLNELDDYSYALVRDQLVANPRITAYYNGTLIWGAEPSGEAGCPTISLTASNNGTLSCSQPMLILTASGGQRYVFSSGSSPVSANQVSVSSEGLYSVTATSANGCVDVASVRVTASTTLPTPDVATRGNAAIADGLTSVTVVQNSAPVRFSAPNCSGTLSWSGHGQSSNATLEAATASPGVFVYQATCSVGSCVSSPASVTLTVVGAPANQPPVAVGNVNQMATVGVPFSYTVNAFTDEQPASLIYSASLEPATGLGFDPVTRVISGTPSASGVVGVTITARDAGNLSASTSFSITVSSPPVGAAVLRVLHRDVDNYADNNAVQPMLQVVNDGAGALPLSALTLRYYLTLEGTAPLSVLSINYAQVGDRNVTLRYVPLNPARQGASGYVEYRFTPDAGSLAPGASSGNIQSYFAKADYSPLNELDDYSYALVRDQLVANPRITAYYNGTLIWGAEPSSGGRQAAAEPMSQLAVRVLGNPVVGDLVWFEVSGGGGAPLQLQLTTLQGRVIDQQWVPRPQASDQYQLSVGGQSAGVYLLQVSTPTQRQSVKVIKEE